MGDALFQTPYAQAHPCRLPERRLLPTLHKYFLFFNFTVFAREGCPLELAFFVGVLEA